MQAHGSYIQIVAMGTLPEMQGKGLGGSLLSAVRGHKRQSNTNPKARIDCDSSALRFLHNAVGPFD